MTTAAYTAVGSKKSWRGGMPHGIPRHAGLPTKRASPLRRRRLV